MLTIHQPEEMERGGGAEACIADRVVAGLLPQSVAALASAGLVIAILLLGFGVPSRAASDEGLELFERRIRPVLVAECYECHSGDKLKGGLALDHRDGLLKGGDSGPAVVPGQADKSLLIQAIRHQRDDLKMPKKAPKLEDAKIRDFIQWVNLGAPDPRDKPVPGKAAAAGSNWEQILAARRDWWSLQPVKKPAPPLVRNTAWSSHPVDRFILAKLEANNLQPAKPADPRTLLRRLTFILTGLPPTPEDLSAYAEAAARDSQSSLERAVDRLLASPQFGERWARHWMDLVRYAESHGSEGDPEIPQVWRYRDYLIRAFNADVPCDRLIREHLAGDLLPALRVNPDDGLNESIIGLASFRLVEHGFQPVDSLDEQVKTVENQIDVLGKAFQGLTLACARCHDHKFDAISQRDFYALYGVLASSRPGQVTIDAPGRLDLNRSELETVRSAIQSRLAAAWIATAERIPALLQPDATNTMAASRLRELEAELAAIDAAARENILRARGETTARPILPRPIAAWSFDKDARDLLGGLHGRLLDGAVLRNGRLVLNGKGAFVRTEPLAADLREKTLETWVALSTLEQGGGGVVTVESGDGAVFDSIVFAERETRQWMAGSDFGRRTRSLEGADAETAPSGELVHMAIAYGANHEITVYRNGVPHGKTYRPEGAELRTFEKGSARLLFGLRHTGGGRAFLGGEIEEARLYDRALTAAEIAASFQAGPATFSTEQLVGAMSTEQRRRHEPLTNELTRLRDRAKTRDANPWTAAIEDARKNKENPLHAWVVLRDKTGSAFTNAWRELARAAEDELKQRRAFNRERFKSAWNLSGADYEKWFKHGTGLPAQSSPPGEFFIEPTGGAIVTGLHPAGIYTHRLTQKDNGVLTSPRFRIEADFLSVRMMANKGGALRVIVDNYPLGVNNTYPRARPEGDAMSWQRLDTTYRKGSWAYLDFTTTEDSTRPERGKNGKDDGRSYFGVAEAVFHDGREAPKLELTPPQYLLEGEAPGSPAELARRYAERVAAAVSAWRGNNASESQIVFLDSFLRRGLLPAALADLETLRPFVARYRELEAAVPVPRRAPGVIEAAGIDHPFLTRGESSMPTDPVPRRYLEVLHSQPFAATGSGRLELANVIASPDNPLTARVMVNRIWSHVFGRGLVPTVDNFGRLGELPSHPELLDDLATRFVANGWSFKQMLRFLVTSKTFQMSSAAADAALQSDPANIWLQHMPVSRLDAEAIRDAMLAVSDALAPTLYGPPVRKPPLDEGRRSVYLAVRRGAAHPFLEVFDAPRPTTTRGKRDVTNLPAQSLTLLNDPFVIGLSERWGAAIVKSGPTSIEGRVDRMFVQALGRSPSDGEAASARKFLSRMAEEQNVPADELLSNPKPWAALAHSLFNLREFIYVR